jgi:hypothetical protein
MHYTVPMTFSPPPPIEPHPGKVPFSFRCDADIDAYYQALADASGKTKTSLMMRDLRYVMNLRQQQDSTKPPAKAALKPRRKRVA